MTKEQINKILSEEGLRDAVLIETHISWVIVCDRFVYKIKKPICYSFLDFSTLEKRKYYCEREIELNRRLTDNVYLDVQPVCEKAGRIFIGIEEGEIIDYAVRMQKLDGNRQMDVLLKNNKVTPRDIENLAGKIAAFHKKAVIIYNKNVLEIQQEFSDLEKEKQYLYGKLSIDSSTVITRAIDASNKFIEKHRELLAHRLKAGFYRDCHGDLHSRNIFLLPDPQPFDCIEFNDEFRQIDVLNEVAFLCMDLDAFGRQDLSDMFLSSYNQLFPVMNTKEDYRLFIYYKSYRANVRAKVNGLRARSAGNDAERKIPLAEAGNYLTLMDGYIKLLA